VSVAVLALKSPKRHIYLDLFEKDKYSCCNSLKSNTVRKTNHSKAKIKSWENEKVTDFQENIDEEKLFTFEQKLSRWQNEIGVTDQAIIDSLLEDLGNIFTGSAKKTFGTFNCKKIDSKINKNKNGQNQKPWFDQDCKFARQKYRKSKRRYKLNNTIRNRSIMIDDEKGYKKVMDEKYRFDVDLMYSFIIPSSPQALLFFKFFIHLS
jgi:hypothetical protein